jgi:hypothetical protein
MTAGDGAATVASMGRDGSQQGAASAAKGRAMMVASDGPHRLETATTSTGDEAATAASKGVTTVASKGRDDSQQGVAMAADQCGWD